MSEAAKNIPDPATLPPVSSIDIKAAYRARVGPVNRAILFLFYYLPLTFSYSVYAAFVFIDDVFRIGLILLGMVGDLLRYRFAPDVRRDWASTVSLFRDGIWSNEVKRAYSRWYCGWEKPFCIGTASYIVIFCIIEGMLPANLFTAYMDFFEPLHDLTRQTFIMASNHSSDLQSRGYDHLVGPVVHLEMVIAFIIIAVPFSICIGGNKCFTITVNERPTKAKKMARWHNNRTKGKKIILNTWSRYLFIFVIMAFLLFPDLYYRTTELDWNSCIRLRLCPHKSLIKFSLVVTTLSLFWGWLGAAMALNSRPWVVTICIWDRQEAGTRGDSRNVCGK